jgi:hypothetical protein
MTPNEEFDYTVLLVLPGYGTERENAETVVESAIEWLNTNKDEPGFRFAYPVSAHLEIVQDIDEARERLEGDDSVAMIVVHDVGEEERDDLFRQCQARRVGACYTVDAPRPALQRNEPMQVVFRKREKGEVPAHTLCAETLTGEVAEDDETGERVGEVIAVLALGVMSFHWHDHYKPPFPR